MTYRLPNSRKSNFATEPAMRKPPNERASFSGKVLLNGFMQAFL